MGVEYSFEVAYGFVMKERPVKFPDHEQWFEDSDDGVMDWFKSNGWDLLWAHEGGNSWSDQHYWYVVLKSSRNIVDPRYDGFKYAVLETPQKEDVEELVAAYNALDLGRGQIGWVMMLHVY